MENHLHRRLVPQKELLGIDQIKQIAILVNKSVSLASTLRDFEWFSRHLVRCVWFGMDANVRIGLGTARTLSSGQWQVVGLVGVMQVVISLFLLKEILEGAM